MKLMKYVYITVIFSIFFSGCALKRGEVILHQEINNNEIQVKHDKTVFIKSINDNRIFEFRPKSANIPSLKEGELDSVEIRSRAVARKRNAYGKALGDILLKDGQTVPSIFEDNLKIAFQELGYNIIDDALLINDKTTIVTLDIEKFWTWMTPGFWALTISTQVETKLSLKREYSLNNDTIEFITKDYFQTGVGGNWVLVMESALRNHVIEIKKKVESLD
jgi:hypothetical protein